MDQGGHLNDHVEGLLAIQTVSSIVESLFPLAPFLEALCHSRRILSYIKPPDCPWISFVVYGFIIIRVFVSQYSLQHPLEHRPVRRLRRFPVLCRDLPI